MGGGGGFVIRALIGAWTTKVAAESSYPYTGNDGENVDP